MKFRSKEMLTNMHKVMSSLISISLLIFLFMDTAVAQSGTRTISGTVRDLQGTPIPGASVTVVVGQNQPLRGTATDIDGKFSITVLSADKSLEIACIGMEKQQIAITSANSYNIAMEESTQQLKDVVVTGVFERKANSYTGSITTVSAEELKMVGNSNVISSLSMIDPSFMIVENLSQGSNPNALPEIQMRGQAGFDNNEPLFIMDGFETSLTAVMDLDMNMVMSVTLLKDATAKAIYGSKAANGVVIIETKRPTKGKIRVTYTGSVDIEAPQLNSYDLTNAMEKLEVEKLAGFYSSESAITQISLDKAYTTKLQSIQAGANTDWMAQPTRVGVGQKHSVYVEGGDDFTTYSANLAYQNVAGVMDGSERKTINGAITIAYRYKNFLFRDKLMVDDNKSANSPYGSFSSYTLLNPYNALKDEAGQTPKMYSGLISEVNPLYNGTVGAFSETDYTSITNNFYAEWQALENLKVLAQFGITIKDSGSDDFKPASHTDFINYSEEDLYRAGSYTKGNGKSNNWNAQLGVNYSISKKLHMLFLNGQVNASQSKSNTTYAYAEGFPSKNLSHFSQGVQFSEGRTPSGSEAIVRDFGFIASANYSFDERYLFDANLRLTGSSQFGSNNRWGSFWSLGLGWNLHKEKFMSNATWLDRLKLRASTGYTGSQGFNTYDAVATITYNTGTQYNGALGSYVNRLANPDLKWQKVFDSNVGVDFNLLNGMISGRFDWYKSSTKGMIASITTPGSTGFTSYKANLGESENKGYEAYLNVRVWQNPATRSFVNVYSSAASNKNKLVKVANALKQQNDNTDLSYNLGSTAYPTEPPTRYLEGTSLNTLWAVPSLGIDPQSGKELFIKQDGTLSFDWNANDFVDCGDKLPTVSGNFGFTAESHGAGINVAFTYQTGGQIYNSTLVSKVENADLKRNVDRRVLTSRWSKPGDEVRFKAISDDSQTKPTSRFVEDYTLVNFATLSLYYDFRECNFVKKSFLQKMKVTFYMNDLATWSSVKIERGTSYPYAKNFSFSLTATF